MSSPLRPEEVEVEAAHALDRLERAVSHLEAAEAAQRRRAAEAAEEMAVMRREAEALHALQNTLASRLDEAIERLKAAIGT